MLCNSFWSMARGQSSSQNPWRPARGQGKILPKVEMVDLPVKVCPGRESACVFSLKVFATMQDFISRLEASLLQCYSKCFRSLALRQYAQMKPKPYDSKAFWSFRGT